MTTKADLYERFMRESNAIESEFDSFSFGPVDGPQEVVILKTLTSGFLHPGDVETMDWFLSQRKITEGVLLDLHKRLYEGRDEEEYRLHLDQVGFYRMVNLISPKGTPVWVHVQALMDNFFLDWDGMDAWTMHKRYEKIHPFEDLNGRTGRLLWAWKARKEGYNFQIPFLQMFYYQTLSQ